MKELNVQLSFIEEVLGTNPNTDEIYREYIASKAPDAATIDKEVADFGIDSTADKGKTIFARNTEGQPFLYDYQIKGFFKDACGALSRVKKEGATDDTAKSKKNSAANLSGKLTAYKKIIDSLIFVKPRKIPLVFSGETGKCERPLRAQTAQGERVALANSETVPEGTNISFTVVCLSDELEAVVKEWLDYGEWRGIGQWRNSGKGRFVWKTI